MALKINIYRFIFISVLGVILHFTYEWSDNNRFIGLFSATNESTWEHLKLLFFPMLLLTILELCLYSNELPANYIISRTAGIIGGMIFIVVAFYTYLGVVGKNYDFINIVIYFIGVFVALLIENKKYSNELSIDTKIGVAVLILITLAFFLFTYNPPAIGLFKKP